MGVKKSRGPERPPSAAIQSLAGFLAWTGGGRFSRAALLASASLVALSAFAAPDRALARCSGRPQTYSTPTTGPVYSDGGAITVTTSGTVTGPGGVIGLPGVLVTACPATALTNSGAINGGGGSSGTKVGGAGVSNSATITALTNSGAISGGAAGSPFGGVVTGGAGVQNSNTIRTLTNSGAINGGSSYALGQNAGHATGGAGVSNAGAITTLTNKIVGAINGSSATGFYGNDAGGAGVANSGTITTLTNSGAINGGAAGVGIFGIDFGSGIAAGGAGISNSGAITTLTNSGAINGGAGIVNYGDAVGGAGVSNAGAITTLSNRGAITGGIAILSTSHNATGGAGVANASTIRTLTNSGTITGGASSVQYDSYNATGGVGAANAGTIATLATSGRIEGGEGSSFYEGGFSLHGKAAGGAGVSNSGAITMLTNSGAITGGLASAMSIGKAVGGAGVSNSGTIAMLTNSGAISGGAASNVHGNAFGGAGVVNSGTIAKLTNSGVISGGGVSAPHGAATPGDAIYSAGSGASIGTIANSGSIAGNVVIDNQAGVTINGGGGKTFGRWTGGAITIGNGDLTFGGGATFLGDNVEVDGGLGTVINEDPLRIAVPQTIAGKFAQVATGALDLDFAGDAWAQYGALTVSGLATLDGRLAIDLTNGFELAARDSFDILSFASLAGPGFDALSLDGAACAAGPVDSWSCGGGVHLTEAITSTSLDLVVARASVVAQGSAIPEPSTWAMLLIGFLGLGGLGLRRPMRAA